MDDIPLDPSLFRLPDASSEELATAAVNACLESRGRGLWFFARMAALQPPPKHTQAWCTFVARHRHAQILAPRCSTKTTFAETVIAHTFATGRASRVAVIAGSDGGFSGIMHNVRSMLASPHVASIFPEAAARADDGVVGTEVEDAPFLRNVDMLVVDSPFMDVPVRTLAKQASTLLDAAERLPRILVMGSRLCRGDIHIRIDGDGSPFVTRRDRAWLGDKESLWPERWPGHMLLNMQRDMGSVDFRAQFEQHVGDEGEVFNNAEDSELDPGLWPTGTFPPRRYA